MIYFQDLNSAGYACPKPMVEFLDNAIHEVFQGKIAKGDIRIMDAGAGTGLVGIELHKHDYSNVDALDISQEMLNEAKKTNVYSKFICAPLSDQRIPGVETGAYDALISVGTLIIAHVRPTAFVEMIRVVRNGEYPPGECPLGKSVSPGDCPVTRKNWSLKYCIVLYSIV